MDDTKPPETEAKPVFLTSPLYNDFLACPWPVPSGIEIQIRLIRAEDSILITCVKSGSTEQFRDGVIIYHPTFGVIFNKGV